MVEVSRKKPLVFNPDEETKEMLIASFVIRKEIFSRIFKDIKEADLSTAPQHFLLVGQRGMGKTTMLLRLKYAIADDAELSNHVITVKFSEEQYQIGSLVDLWEEVMHHLENQDAAFKGLYKESIQHEREKDYERTCFTLLTKKLKQENKRIILLIDNINDLFEKLTEIETRRLREVLMTSRHLQLIGASSSVLEHNFKYDKPFFEFFAQIKLEPIGRAETIDLMKALGENYDASNKITEIIKNNPQRIEALRRITGGVPRTLVLLFEILVDSDHGEAFEDLETLTDRVTALYKERMDSLKPQQQKIMDALARAWEPITANEVLEHSKLYREGMASNQVSSQLKQLEDNQLVEVVKVKGQKNSYRIRERFFNIWYLMRHGQRSVKEKVLWLVRFLETWCSPEELRELANNQIAYLKKGRYSPKAAYYKAIALHCIEEFDTESKKELLHQTEKFLLKINNSEWANTIRSLSKEIESNAYLAKAHKALEEGDHKLAEKYFLAAVKNNEKNALFNIGLFYQATLENFEKAEQFYLAACNENDYDAMNNLAEIYWQKGDLKKAEDLYVRAANQGHLKAIVNLGTLYLDQNKPEMAEPWLIKASANNEPVAMFNLGFMYEERGEIQKAEDMYRKASKLNDDSSMLNLGHIYAQRNNFARAERYWNKASNLGNVRAMYNLGLLYETKNKLGKAESFYEKAANLGDAEALLELGRIYKVQGELHKAEQSFQKASEAGLTTANFHLGLLYEDMNKLEQAENAYRKSSEAGHLYSKGKLALLYLSQDKNFDEAEHLLEESINNGLQQAVYGLIANYFAQQKYAQAENLCKQLLAKKPDDYRALMQYAVLMVYLNRLNEAMELGKQLFSLEDFFKDRTYSLRIAVTFMKLKQYHFLLEEYQKENSLLSKYFFPLYYVIAWFLRDELPGEYEKAGDEIKESVDDIIRVIESNETN